MQQKVWGWFVTEMFNFEGSVFFLNVSYYKKRVGELNFDFGWSWHVMLLQNYEATPTELKELQTESCLFF